jgi:hypothetical protein
MRRTPADMPLAARNGLDLIGGVGVDRARGEVRRLLVKMPTTAAVR